MLGMILYYIVLDPCCNVMEDITYCWILETYNVRDDITYCWILATMSGMILHSAGSLLQFQGWYYIVLDPCYTTLQYNTLLLLLNKYCEINSTTLEDTVLHSAGSLLQCHFFTPFMYSGVNNNAESEFWFFYAHIKYLREILALFKNTLACLSGAKWKCEEHILWHCPLKKAYLA